MTRHPLWLSIPALVAVGSMLTAIEFHDQSSGAASKVRNVTADRALSHKAHAQTRTAQPGPEPPFRFGRLTAHSTSPGS
jgi:hypothetical protein